MLLCLMTLPCRAQAKSPFHEIRDGYVSEKKENTNEREDCSARTECTPSYECNGVVNEYATLTTLQLESFIDQFETLLNNKVKACSQRQGNVYSYYSGEKHDLTIYNLLDVMGEVGLNNRLFVLAQAVVETGHFKSHVCREYNNLFGLRNPKTHTYYRFSRWEDSVVGYQKFVQYKYKGGNYLSFLKRIGYAEAPDYVRSVAKVAKQLYEQLQAEGKLS